MAIQYFVNTCRQMVYRSIIIVHSTLSLADNKLFLLCMNLYTRGNLMAKYCRKSRGPGVVGPRGLTGYIAESIIIVQ